MSDLFRNFAHIEQKLETMTIIGVAGGTGSGKTTVVHKLAEALPHDSVAVIPMDAYYKDEAGLTDEEKKNLNVDHPDAFDWDLFIHQARELKAGKAIELPTYSYAKFARLPETIHIEPKPVIIFEGIMLFLNKELRDMFDLKIFVDTDADERFIRTLQRDLVERGRTVELVIDRYLRMKKPMHEQFVEPTKKYADLIIPQGGENLTGIHILHTFLKGIVTHS